MDFINWEELLALINSTETNNLSIYMPTFKASNQTEQNAIRFKDQLKTAKKLLHEKGMRDADIDTFLLPLKEQLENNQFWQQQEQGLALFRNSEKFDYYRLPVEFPEIAYLNRYFYIPPLLPLFCHNNRYYVLGLNQGGCRLFDGRYDQFQEIEVPELNKDIQDFLSYDDPESQLQLHTGVSGRGGEGTFIYHGQGVGTDDSRKKVDIERYFHYIDDRVRRYLNGKNEPLILIGVEYLVGIYREVNSYPHLFSQAIDANPQDLSLEQMHSRCWGLIEPHFEAKHGEMVDRFHKLKSTEKATNQLETILPAALNKRVDTLFVAEGSQIWGNFDEEKQKVEAGPRDHELINLAALWTFRANGRIVLQNQSDMPDENPLAAIFRY